MTDRRLPPKITDFNEVENKMYTITSLSNSTDTIPNNQSEVGPNLPQDEKDRSPTKPGVQRGRLYYGWTKSRWLLLFSNIFFMLYATMAFIACMVTYGEGYTNAPIVVAANASILGVTLAFSLLSMVVACIGMAGIIRKDRRLLGWYCLWLWPCFGLLCAIGYLGYKQDTWNLSAKLGMQWRYNLSSNARIALQNTLHCCGFDNPSDHATYFDRCFPKSLLPGCEYKLHQFESSFLKTTYIVAFSFVPVQLIVMIFAILCSNHVTLQFGRRARPNIAYLNGHSDWRTWEQEQKQKKASESECDAKGLPYKFSPIDLYSPGKFSLESEILQAQDKTFATGGAALSSGEVTRRRSGHRQVQR
ncbi:hypothetical protein K450DRAFT_222220 [Umbelopsis ramanniana AG]|uniref:Tetraspanin Tsp2 n=1 Tax=Umbelopsis ramanniana AG TaxID=1314678 RepID=A0AAD5HIV6_UMBRA|nr:uncharacterized protein K450DRAFT_222220 [Umbelopsis ramanniana AG]KAI8583668.1 hypothetical protein K450DRAFT_222220 [Umbelopsis ramanniana AG]